MQVVLGDRGVLIPGLRVSQLTTEEERRLLRFADILEDSERGLVVRRNRRLSVGRTAIGSNVIISPPPMATAEFFSLLYVALGGDIQKALVLPDFGGASEGLADCPEAFLTGLAACLLDEAERILRIHLSRGYATEVERRQVLRGRPQWTRDFGGHPAQGIACSVARLTTDVVHNHIVFAGLICARHLLEGSALRERIDNQVFVWSALITPRQVTPADFVAAARYRNRLNEHYDSAVAMSRALVLGVGIPDAFSSGEIRTVHFEFSLPGLFEQLLLRLLKPLEAVGLYARFKSVDSGAFIDGRGETYREIEPDITIWLGDRPVAVIDAKFKPRYVKAQANGRISYSDRVTNEDLYQLFFYQSRLQAQHGLLRAPIAVIAAPICLSHTQESDDAARTIVWRDAQGQQATLKVEGVRLPALTEALQTGNDENSLLSLVAPGLSLCLMHLTPS